MGGGRTIAARSLRGGARVRRAIKQAAAWIALRSGLLARHRRRAGDVILLYHRVVTDGTELLDYSPYGVSVTVESFADQMAFLARHYEVVPLEALRQPRVSARPRCAITFDDGWRDNLTAAWPILERHGLPATIFLATNMMSGGEWFWEERLMARLAHCHQRQATAGARLDAVRREPELAEVLRRPAGQVPRALAALIRQVHDDPARRDAVLRAVDDAVRQPGLEPPPWFLSWDEVRTLAAAGVAFGGHTASHVNLSRSSDDEARREIAACGQALAEHLGDQPRAFAYPYGKSSPAARAAVAAASFTCAVTTERRLLNGRDELFRLPRIDVYQDVADSVPLFACRIVRFLNAY